MTAPVTQATFFELETDAQGEPLLVCLPDGRDVFLKEAR